MSHLEEGLMWEAVKSNDGSYDGVFFYGVQTTRIFCRPSCKSKMPLQGNVMYFPIADMAIEKGFRPCKRCRPDLLEVPDEGAIMQAARQILQQEYTSAVTLDALSKRVGMSKYHLQRLFKQQTGYSPSVYLTMLRIRNASKLLTDTEESITAIAHMSGYRSSAHFSDVFRTHVGCSPTEYRNRNTKGAVDP